MEINTVKKQKWKGKKKNYQKATYQVKERLCYGCGKPGYVIKDCRNAASSQCMLDISSIRGGEAAGLAILGYLPGAGRRISISKVISRYAHLDSSSPCRLKSTWELLG